MAKVIELDAVVCMLVVHFWCDLGCCSRTVIVLKAKENPAFINPHKCKKHLLNSALFKGMASDLSWKFFPQSPALGRPPHTACVPSNHVKVQSERLANTLLSDVKKGLGQS